MIYGIDLGLSGAAPVQHIARGLHLPFAVAFRVQQEKLQFKRRNRMQAKRGHRIDLTAQCMAGIRQHWCAVKMILRQQEFRSGRLCAILRDQRAWHRPCAKITVACVPD